MNYKSLAGAYLLHSLIFSLIFVFIMNVYTNLFSIEIWCLLGGYATGILTLSCVNAFIVGSDK